MSRKMLALALIFGLGLALSCIGNLHSQEQVPSSVGSIKSLNLQHADIHSALDFLSSYSGVNIVAGPTVEGEITLQIRDVTWRQALNIITETNGLVVVEGENYLRVLPQKDFIAEEMARGKYEADKANLGKLETRVFYISHGRARALSRSLKDLTSSRGKIEVDERTNSLIIMDRPDNLETMSALIDSLDRETPQIRIEAKLLEIDTSTLWELGIDWSAIRGGSNPLEVSQSTAGEVTQAIGKFTYGTVRNSYDLNAAIASLASQNKAQILAQPSISTMDNQTATILMGQEIPLKMFDQAGNVVIKMYQVGTKLIVTPHVTSPTKILMHLRPERSSYSYDPNGIIISTQKAETNVVVSDGETVVIGGLTNQEKKSVQKGIPILKDIPLLGMLFRYTKHETVTNDLVIFVTPHLVKSDEVGQK